MKIQRLLIALTVVNLGLLMFVLTEIQPAVAQDAVSVLRGRALEIVDDRGRVRASIIVQPAGAMPDGTTYPETVMFRLIDPNGRPNVKLGASPQGAGLGLGGDSDPTYVVLKAQGANASLKLTNKEGRDRLITP
jgi:hypothetical protein